MDRSGRGLNARIFGCRKFQRLTVDQQDRELTARESEFMDRHRQVCPACQQSEQHFAAGLNMLRAAALDPEAPSSFEDRVIRRLKLNKARESLGYWAPAFAGAAIACLTIVAALQMITRASDLPQFSMPRGEAMRYMPSDDYPQFILQQVRQQESRR